MMTDGYRIMFIVSILLLHTILHGIVAYTFLNVREKNHHFLATYRTTKHVVHVTLSLAERRHKLGKRFFQRIIKDKSNVLFYLLPAKRDVQLKTRLRCARQYPTIYARTNRCKNSFILFGLNHFQWCDFVYFVYAWFSCRPMFNSAFRGCQNPINVLCEVLKRCTQTGSICLTVCSYLLC